MIGWRKCRIVAWGIALAGVCSPAWAEGVPVSEATPDQVAAAQRTFQQADELFDVQNYAEAIAKYRKSYDTVASPNSLLMVARSLRELGRLDEAFREYSITLEAAQALAEDNEAYVTTAQAARDELQALRSRVAWLRIELGDVPEDAALTVAGKPVETEDLAEPIVVVPGRIDVLATAADGRAARAEVHLAAGREGSVTLKLDETVTVGTPAPSAPEPKRPTRASSPEPVSPTTPEAEPRQHGGPYMPLGIAAGGIGIAGFAVFGVFGSQARAKFNDLEDACPDASCPGESQDDIDTGRRAQTLANVGLTVGAVGLAASGVFFYLGHRRKQHVALTVLPGSVAVRGSF